MCLLLVSNVVVASENMTKEKWEQLTSGKDYGYKHEVELSEITIDNRKENFIANLIDMGVQFFASPLGKLLVVSVILLIVLYAVARIILNERRRLKNKKPEKKEEEQEAENILPEDLLQNNWEHLLQDALKTGNTRLAIRYSYMHLLQLLQKNQHINYRTSKTNYDYYFEIKQPELRQYFKLLSRQYELVWYGNYELAPDKLAQFNDTFHQSIKALKK